MTSDLVPIHPAPRPAKVKDVAIAVLALCLCFCLLALIHETRKRQEYARLYAGQVEKSESEQRISAQALAQATLDKQQSDQALRRAQLAMKAGTEAQDIALRLRQAAAKPASRPR